MSMPKQYQPPWDTPLRWQDEMTGVLPAAVNAFLAHMLNEAQPLSLEQFALVRDYLTYYINAPCFLMAGGLEDTPTTYLDALTFLRLRAPTLATNDEVNDWLLRCLELAIDPL